MRKEVHFDRLSAPRVADPCTIGRAIWSHDQGASYVCELGVPDGEGAP